MIAVIDNYDSFTYNLVQYLGELGAEVQVYRNDAVSVEELQALRPSHIVISPGPGTPDDAGVSNEIIRRLGPEIPILGVCLGHQCMGQVFGGEVRRAPRLMHGKVSRIHHDGAGLFAGLPDPIEATRYHSLIVAEPLPEVLQASAHTEEGELMALRHKEYPVFGVQFHPESILTPEGKQILRNFLEYKPGAEKSPPSPKPASRPAEEQAAAEDTDRLKSFIAKVMQRQDLSAEEAEQAMGIIMGGAATPAQIGGYLMALRMKGESVSEITGSARAMYAAASRVTLPTDGQPIVDIVGTGGDGSHTFNISTAAAFVVAGTGRRVAKHGNRAASSRCGSADVLGALGVNLDLSPEQVGQCIQEVGIGFLFAPKFHPAMKHAVGPRRELGQRTIFNILGPLTNPAGATHLMVGVYQAELTQTLAEVLCGLGGKSAYVVHGHGGLDELTTSGPNRLSQLRDGQVTTYELDAADLGLRRASLDDLRGGEPTENARMLRALLSGEDDSPRRDVVLLNAAVALATLDNGDVPTALRLAEESLGSGAALAKLEALIGASQKFATAN